MAETYTVDAGQTLDLTFTIFEPGTREITINLVGSGASASLRCLIATDQGDTALHVVQNHLVPNTTSSVLIKGVLTGTAHARVTGLITIAKDAAGCQANQYHKVLLLSPGARAIAIPQFSVSNHRVKCNHGAAVGKVDAQQLLYLQTRGLSEQTATQMIVNGFMEEVVGTPRSW